MIGGLEYIWISALWYSCLPLDEKALKKIQFYVNKNGMIFLEDFWKLDGLAVMTKLLMGYITKDASYA